MTKESDTSSDRVSLELHSVLKNYRFREFQLSAFYNFNVSSLSPLSVLFSATFSKKKIHCTAPAQHQTPDCEHTANE